MRALIGKLIEWLLGYKHDVCLHYNDDAACRLPVKSHIGDAGYDLYCDFGELKELVVQPNTVADIPTKVRFFTKHKIWWHLVPRSSAMLRYKLDVRVAVLDGGYRGEFFMMVYNTSNEEVKICNGDRLGQIIPHRVIDCAFDVVTELQWRKLVELYDKGNTRGEKGFGSTGAS